MSSGDTIGIMDPAFFVSKNEILTWLNGLLQVTNQTLHYLIVKCTKSRIMCDWGCLLLDH